MKTQGIDTLIGRKVRTQYGEIGTIIQHEPHTAGMNDILVQFDEGRGVYVESDRCWYALRCSTLLDEIS